MSAYDIVLRAAERQAFCRGCDDTITKGEQMVSTYSFRNRGQHIHFCIKCAEVIGTLANSTKTD